MSIYSITSFLCDFVNIHNKTFEKKAIFSLVKKAPGASLH